MDIDSIIKKNKEKRHSYVSEKKENLTPKLKYLKGLISRFLIVIILVLGSLIFTNISEENKKLYKEYVLENSLEFTKINNLYEKLFGKVDMVKTPNKETTSVFLNTINYSNIENFKNGFKLSLNAGEIINVITSGIIVYIGPKDDLGNTVIVQGNDGVDIWYSNITDTDIKVYDYIESGAILGTANSNYIYLTLNKDGKYLNYEEYLSSI